MSAPPTHARALFAAARDDGPDASGREALFRKIALSSGIAAGTAAGAKVLTLVPSAGSTGVAAAAAQATSTAVTSAAAGSPFAFALGSKLLALGVVLGAVSSALGVVVAVTLGATSTPDASHASNTSNQAVSAVTAAAPAAIVALPVAPARGTASSASAVGTEPQDDADEAAITAAKAIAEAKADAKAKAKAKADAKPHAGPNAMTVASSGGDLGEEARLVTAARTALVAGDAARALSLVQATRKLGTRSLEPEELGLEARALRALGRADEAAVAELFLRRRYPEHALAH